LRQDAQRQVVLMTDGYIGFEHEIVGRIARSLPAGCRLHAVGIGSAPNRTLVHGAARAGRGGEFIVRDDAGAREAAGRLLAASARPVLTDLVIHGSALEALAPARPGDVFAGRPLVLTVELETKGGVLELEGHLAGSPEPWRHRIEVPATREVSSPIPIGALHGREAIADLEQELAAGGDAETLGQQIESRGLRHRVTSSRTSLVAIAEEPSVDPKQPRRRERLAVELPAGVSAEGVGLMAGQMPLAERIGMLELAKSAVLLRRPAGTFMAAEARRSGADASAIPATIVRHDADLLVVEFAVPTDGMELPKDAVEVILGGRSAGRATVDLGESSPAGPHRAGLLVRLALRFDWEAEWRPGEELMLHCQTQRQGPRAGRATVVLRVTAEAGKAP
ncbi:MAG TPA: hypothetical protein VI792_05015, partial [Candidatus Eisenbacteria bacterium]